MRDRQTAAESPQSVSQWWHAGGATCDCGGAVAVTERMVYRNPYDGYSEGEYSPYSGQEELYGGREQQYYTTQQAQVV